MKNLTNTLGFTWNHVDIVDDNAYVFTEVRFNDTSFDFANLDLAELTLEFGNLVLTKDCSSLCHATEPCSVSPDGICEAPLVEDTKIILKFSLSITLQPIQS